MVSLWQGFQRVSNTATHPTVDSPTHASSFCCPTSGQLTSHWLLFLFSGLDSLPPNRVATLSIPPAHSHTYRMSMWYKAPSSSWPINTASRFRWKTWLTSENFSWIHSPSSHPARLGSWSSQTSWPILGLCTFVKCVGWHSNSLLLKPWCRRHQKLRPVAKMFSESYLHSAQVFLQTISSYRK